MFHLTDNSEIFNFWSLSPYAWVIKYWDQSNDNWDFFGKKNVKKKLNFFWRHVTENRYIERQIWEHITFLPSYKEHFATIPRSLWWLVQKLSLVMCFRCFLVTLTLTLGQFWENICYSVPATNLSRYLKISLIGSKLWSLEGEERDEEKSPMLHNGNIRCHWNTCSIRPIILNYFISYLFPHIHKWLNFGINRTTIEHFFEKNNSKFLFTYFDVTWPKIGTSYVKKGLIIFFGHPTMNIFQLIPCLYDGLLKSYDSWSVFDGFGDLDLDLGSILIKFTLFRVRH